jgi:hypothetical protein
MKHIVKKKQNMIYFEYEFFMFFVEISFIERCKNNFYSLLIMDKRKEKTN